MKLHLHPHFKRLLFVGIALVSSVNTFAQSFDKENINVEETGIVLRYPFVNPYSFISKIRASLDQDLMNFESDSIPAIRLWTFPYIRDQSFSNFNGLLRQTKYLRPDSSRWMHFSMEASFTDAKDTASVYISPGSDTMLIEGFAPEFYSIFGTLKEDIWTFESKTDKAVLVTEEHVGSEVLARNHVRNYIYNRQKNLVFKQEGRTECLFVNDTTVFGSHENFPDSLIRRYTFFKSVFPSYTVTLNAVPGHGLIYDDAYKVTFNNTDTFFIATEDMLGWKYSSFSKKKGLSFSADRDIPILKNYSTTSHYYEDDFTAEDYVLFEGRGKVLDFRLSLHGENKFFGYSDVIFLPPSDSLDSIQDLISIFEPQWRLGISDLYLLSRHNGIPLIRLDSFNRDVIYDDITFEVYSASMANQDSFFHSLFAGPLDKKGWKSIKKSNHSSSIKLTEKELEKYSNVFLDNYVIYQLSDTGFVLFDYKYGSYIMSNPINQSYVEDRVSKDRIFVFRRKSKNLQGKDNYRNVAEFKWTAFEKVRKGSKTYWRSVSPHPGNKIDSLYIVFNDDKKEGANASNSGTLVALKHKEHGWIYSTKISGVDGHEVQVLNHSDLGAYRFRFITEANRRGYRIECIKEAETDEVYTMVQSGAICVDGLGAITPEKDESIRITIEGVEDVFSIDKSALSSKSQKSALNALDASKWVGTFGLFYPEDEVPLKLSGEAFNGAISVLKIPSEDNILPFVIDDKNIAEYNPEVVGTLQSLNAKYKSRFTLGTSSRVFMNYEHRHYPHFNSLRDFSANWIYIRSSVEIYQYKNGILDSILRFNFQGEKLSAVSPASYQPSELEELRSKWVESDSTCSLNTFDDLYAGFRNREVNLSEVINDCVSSKEKVYAYKQKIERHADGRLITEQFYGQNPKEMQKAWKYTVDSLQGTEKYITYFYDGFILKDSAVLQLKDGILSGETYELNSLENNISSLEHNAEYWNAHKYWYGRRQFSTSNHTYIFKGDGSYSVAHINSKLDTFDYHSYRDTAFDASSFFQECLNGRVAYHRNKHLKHEQVVRYHKGKRIAEINGDWVRIYNPNQDVYLELNSADTCVNCDTLWNKNPVVEEKKKWFKRKRVEAEYTLQDAIGYRYNVFYSNGELMGVTKPKQGREYHASFSADCDDSTRVFVYPFQFTSFYDSLGKQTFDGRNGYVKLLGSHDLAIYEVAYKDSVRNGLYKGYSASGKLDATGYYQNGLKQGTWFTGSLDGRVDWALVCKQSIGKATNAVQESFFVGLTAVEYDQGVIVDRQYIQYKKE